MSSDWACSPETAAAALSWAAQSEHALLAVAVQTILAAACALVDSRQWPRDRTQDVVDEPTFDFIVVGAGSAGAVVANRLTEVADWKVLLVEAGGDPTISSEIPAPYLMNLNTSIDWKYFIEPQEKACLSSKNQQCYWPRGKTLGGCSAINPMFYVRGNPMDYDEWHSLGNSGWSYEDVLPFFKKSENVDPSDLEENDLLKYHKVGGYLSIEKHHPKDPYVNTIIGALKESGIEEVIDINGKHQLGVTKSYSNLVKGQRQSTARAFLSPIKDRENLYVVKNALATKVNIDDVTKTATSVDLTLKDGTYLKVNARKEVILSAGAINSPQLLMLSGIGPQPHLKDLEIDCIKDLAVGKNLQDHVLAPSFILIENSQYEEDLLKKYSLQIVEYLLNHKGFFSNNQATQITSFINTANPKASYPDIQYHFLIHPKDDKGLNTMYYKLHHLTDEIIDAFTELNRQGDIIQPVSVLLKPKSIGEILLRSKDPNDHPIINANYFDQEEDLNTIVEGIKTISNIVDNPSLKKINAKLGHLKLKACETFAFPSDEYYKCIARQLTATLYHPVGTAKMGPSTDPNAVVDDTLKVHGVNGLRVIDASIMPTIIRGNTNAPTIMIGEKGADLIKSFWLRDEIKEEL